MATVNDLRLLSWRAVLSVRDGADAVRTGGRSRAPFPLDTPDVRSCIKYQAIGRLIAILGTLRQHLLEDRLIVSTRWRQAFHCQHQGVVELPQVVDDDDARVPQSRNQLPLADEALAKDRVSC